jgi:hypothetical protein
MAQQRAATRQTEIAVAVGRATLGQEAYAARAAYAQNTRPFMA